MFVTRKGLTLVELRFTRSDKPCLAGPSETPPNTLGLANTVFPPHPRLRHAQLRVIYNFDPHVVPFATPIPTHACTAIPSPHHLSLKIQCGKTDKRESSSDISSSGKKSCLCQILIPCRCRILAPIWTKPLDLNSLLRFFFSLHYSSPWFFLLGMV